MSFINVNITALKYIFTQLILIDFFPSLYMNVKLSFSHSAGVTIRKKREATSHSLAIYLTQ